jgi:hypothetical protein
VEFVITRQKIVILDVLMPFVLQIHVKMYRAIIIVMGIQNITPELVQEETASTNLKLASLAAPMADATLTHAFQ